MTREEAIKILKSKMDGTVDTSYEWAEAVRMAIEALHKTEWIPCSERLPEATGVYIVTCNIYSGDKADGVTATWSYWRRNEWMMKDVLAWMPLPAPYKEDTE